ncbi:hypothetical protein GCWU000324_01092 [Kingella oralis ATCC 51147]|uniref:Uncharacterized protein n=1 Tax=Kingella oralis ATCC 51147 TaxID=629741 RepID=C4GG25_9NEIS|nr:hypothetical protein GCWU000324_01092 [Kingella oralis ATCC 51147]
MNDVTPFRQPENTKFHFQAAYGDFLRNLDQSRFRTLNTSFLSS